MSDHLCRSERDHKQTRELYPHRFMRDYKYQYTDVMDKKILFMSGLLSTTVIGLLATVQYPVQEVLAETTAQTLTVPFTTIVQGEQSGVAARVNYLITSPDELSALWASIRATSTPPSIDFTTQAVLAIFAGESSEASVSVAKITDALGAGQRMVSIAITKPDVFCTGEVTTTSPYAIVAVPATSLPLTHEDIVTTANCAN